MPIAPHDDHKSGPTGGLRTGLSPSTPALSHFYLHGRGSAAPGPVPAGGGACQRRMIGRTSRLGAQDALGGVGPAEALTTSKGFDPHCGRTSENTYSRHLVNKGKKGRP
jgi:hypothetical protein